MEAPFISSHPIEGLSVRLETLSQWNERWFDCGMTRLEMGEVPVHLTCGLDLEQTDSDAFHMNIYLPPISAATLRDSLPSGIVPSIQNAEFTGEVEGLFELLSPIDNLLDSYVDLRLDLSQLEVNRLPDRLTVAQLTDAIEIEVSPTGERHRHVGPKREDWVSYTGVSSLLFDALVNAEDSRFWEHNGFDRQSIIGAFRDNISQGRVVRGGSTISQQLARSLYLGQERSLGRKLEEAFLTWQIESHLEKEQILEWYVNTVHWGPDVYGIREASSHYFSVSPEQLSLTEAVFLASILSNPNLYGSEYQEGEISQSRQDKSCNILQNMHSSGLLNETEHSIACDSIREGRISPSQERSELIYPAVCDQAVLSVRAIYNHFGDHLVSISQP
jgi:monofunctional biosynthetic peptidoglycan transglycosylase